MKPTLVSLFILLSYSNVFSQDISAGLRVGGSKWSDRERAYTNTTPDIGMFLRTEPIKRLALEISFSGYGLDRNYSRYVPNSNATDIKQRLRCREVGIMVQYNYVRLFNNKLKLYTGMDSEPTYVNLTAEEYNIRNYRSPVIPYQKTEMGFWFYLIGFNHTFTYDIGRITATTTIFYRGNSSGILMHEAYYPGTTRIGLQGSISYKILK